MRSMVSRMTALREAGEDFRCHGATSAAILPVIIGATGSKGVVRDEVPPLDEPAFEEKSKGLPKDLRLPAFLLAMNSFCNMMCYNIEFGTFAIYFKDVYGWNDAMFASLAQTAGDVTAALAMQVAPYFLPNSGDPEEMNRCSRTMYYLVSQPYNLSLIIVLWVITNIGMMSPVLAVAIVAQVLMGTVYVYSFKMTTELCLFFSILPKCRSSGWQCCRCSCHRLVHCGPNRTICICRFHGSYDVHCLHLRLLRSFGLW